MKHKLYCNTLGCKMAFAVKGIVRMLSRRFEEEGLALTLEQYFILNILDNEEGLILQDLAEIVDRDKSAVLRHIDSLEAHHFVLRAADPDDKRRKLLIVTKPGVSELKRARAIERELHREVTAGIDNSLLERMEELLSDIYEKSLACQ